MARKNASIVVVVFEISNGRSCPERIRVALEGMVLKAAIPRTPTDHDEDGRWDAGWCAIEEHDCDRCAKDRAGPVLSNCFKFCESYCSTTDMCECHTYSSGEDWPADGSVAVAEPAAV